jgi:hypothetical protein
MKLYEIIYTGRSWIVRTTLCTKMGSMMCWAERRFHSERRAMSYFAALS